MYYELYYYKSCTDNLYHLRVVLNLLIEVIEISSSSELQRVNTLERKARV